MYNLGVSVTTSTGEKIEFIQMKWPSEQQQWLLHLREKHPNHIVKPAFWKGGKWVTR